MVVPFSDTANRSRHYATSNADYGNFYGTVMGEEQRDDYGCDCNTQAARRAEEVKEAKTRLKMVDCTRARSSQREDAPRGACWLNERIAPDSRCQFDHRATECHENPDKLGRKAWNCGESHEFEFLEDHVRHCHPRLAPKVQFLAKGCTRTTNRRELQGGSVDVRPVGSRGGFGVGLQVGLQGKTKKRRSRPASPVRGCSAGPGILPASHRYGFYRYYGAAGQGAKTSGDHKPRL